MRYLYNKKTIYYKDYIIRKQKKNYIIKEIYNRKTI